MSSLVVSLLAGLALGAVFALLLAALRNNAARAGDQQAIATQTERIQALQERLQGRESEFTTWQQTSNVLHAEVSQLGAALAVAKATSTQEREAAQDKLALLERTREEMTLRFKQLSQEILEDKSLRFTEQNRLNIEQVLTPLREKIAGFEQQVKQSYELETRDRVALKEQIAQLAQLNQKVSLEANNLAGALRGQSKTQGNWGELILERILELSGLQNGREYETQISAKDESGRQFRPDVIVHLPGERDMVIDAKVSLTAYVRLAEAADEAGRTLALAEHVASVRRHINELGDKRYQSLIGVASLDFVLMFIPSEAAYIEAVRAAPQLYEEALTRNVGLVCPSTLLPTLRTVENLWKVERQSRNALLIADEAGKLYDKFAGFEQDLSRVGSALALATKAYGEARGKLVEGPGNVVRKIEQLKKLGAKAGKQLPEGVLREALSDESAGSEQD